MSFNSVKITLANDHRRWFFNARENNSSMFRMLES